MTWLGHRPIVCAAVLACAPSVHAQTASTVHVDSAVGALQVLLDRNIDPPAGPLAGDGATIAGILAGQSLTFPIASSSGAFVTRNLGGFGVDIPVSSSGSFGPLFAERALTNGRRNLSVSVNYQNKAWRSVSGIGLQDFDMKARFVYREDTPGVGPAGTVEEAAADIDFTTDVFVLAANYGVLSFLDVGVSMPYVIANVDGVKRRTRTVPQEEPVTLSQQRVEGSSQGWGDVLLRFKSRVPLERMKVGRGLERVYIAGAYDLRLPTGKTVDLVLDCRVPPCAGAQTQTVPDIGLGKTTHKWSFLASSELGRVSPHLNVSYVRVPSYDCDPNRFDESGECRGSIFTVDPRNGTQDAKNQDLSDEWNAAFGFDYELQPYRITMSFDVIVRQLIRAGQFYDGPSRVIIRADQPLDQTVSTEVESRHGNVTPIVGSIGAKFGFKKRWVAVGNLLFPLNDQGLQPGLTVVVGLERAFVR